MRWLLRVCLSRSDLELRLQTLEISCERKEASEANSATVPEEEQKNSFSRGKPLESFGDSILLLEASLCAGSQVDYFGPWYQKSQNWSLRFSKRRAS